MNDLLFSPVGPALVLFATGVLLRLLPRVQRSSVLAAVLLAPLMATLLLLVRLRLLQAPDLTAVWWPLVTAPLQLRWSLDGWNWLALLLLTIVGLCAVLLTWRLPGPRSSSFHGLSLLLLSSAALTVASGNVFTLSGAWIAGDALLIARAREPRAPEGAVRGGLVAVGSLLITLAVYITNAAGITAPWSVSSLPAEAVILLSLAAALRMAVYPLHQWLMPSQGARTQGTQLLLGGVALVTGGWLLGRLYTLSAGTLLAAPFWPPLLATLTLAAALAAWASAEGDDLTLLIASRSGWLGLIVALAAPGLGRDALGWGLVAAVLGIALFVVGRILYLQWGWRLPLALSVGLVAGLPFLAGFPARALAPSQGALLWVLLALSDGLVLAVMLRPLFQSRAPTSAGPLRAVAERFPFSSASSALSAVAAPNVALAPFNWPFVRLVVAFGLLAVPMFIWGLRPNSLAQLAGFDAALSLAEALRVAPASQWLATVVGLALGVGLTWTAAQPELTRGRQQLAAILHLDWGLDAALRVFTWAGSMVRLWLRVVEGEGYLGWVALLALLIWLIAQG